MRPRRLPLPPGPPEKSWITGNAADMPSTHPWFKFTEWAKAYGDVVHTRVYTQSIIVISSYEAIVDLFEKRGALYSYRPTSVMANMMGWGKLIPLRGYDERWKVHRRHANFGFSKTAAAKYHDGQSRDVRDFLRRMLSNPEGLANELNLLIATIIMRVVYGYTVTDAHDPYVTLSDEAIAALAPVGVAGNYLVDTFHFLQYLPTWLPGMHFKIQAQEWRGLSVRMIEGPYQWALKEIKEGRAIPSFVSELLEQNIGGEEGEDIIKWTAGSMYNAGQHTTVGTLNNFVLAMILYPEIAHKAREEMDRVVGTERLPEMSDRPNLPYLECVLLETMRWHPPVPLSLPHLVEVDDMYRGYHIPANSIIFSNIYAITRDERIFPDPEAFIPERFDGTHSGPAPLDPREIVFGIGRRICPGNNIADASIYLVMANLIATMDFTKARDNNGKEIEPKVVRTGGIVSQTLPFGCCIKPRSERAVKLINSAILFDHE